MIRGLAAAALLAAASCSTAPEGLALPRLEAGASPPGEPVNFTGRLVRSGACLAALDSNGGGTTVIIWARAARARAGGNVLVVWPFGRANPPILMGGEVEMAGLIVTADNLSGFARIPADPGCRGERYLLLREARSAPLESSAGSAGARPPTP